MIANKMLEKQLNNKSDIISKIIDTFEKDFSGYLKKISKKEMHKFIDELTKITEIEDIEEMKAEFRKLYTETKKRSKKR